ncbi:MAG: Quinoprotein glucose dehydrogenase [Acidobacteria bacterium]|nr:Quinoprotein glucose dehydrogenase [Acidobacteriota bacterium]
MPRLWIVLCCLALTACDRRSPPAPPDVGTPPATETINGTERIGWDQPAADAVELAAIRYAIYVDGGRSELGGVSCDTTTAGAAFACTAPLPSMSRGAHTLELSSFVNDGGVLESARSAALHVTVAAQTLAAADAPVLRRGLALKTTVVGGLESPADLAIAPDGRIFVAERAGRIRIIRDGRLLHEPALALDTGAGAIGQLLALALDPQFPRTGYVYAIATGASRTGDPAFTLTRFRVVSDTLADPFVLLDEVPASPRPAAALRFGPDGKLYAAFDDAGESRRRLDPGSFNGKVLRLDAGGTTPADAAGRTPIYAAGYGSPIAIDWDPSTATLWVADRAAAAAPFAIYRGALMPAWNGRLMSADTLFDRGAGGGGPIAVGPDGAIYVGTSRGVARAAPEGDRPVGGVSR